MSQLCPKCQYFVGAPLLFSTALILLGIEFIRDTQVVAGILFHPSTMTSRSCWMLRHMVLLHLPLEDASHMLNRVKVWKHTWPLLHLQQQGSCHLGDVFGVVVMLENSFWREGIIFCRMSQYMLESMFPLMNHSSPVPAVVMQPQNMMLPPPCLTVGKAQFSWYSSPGVATHASHHLSQTNLP